MFSELRAPAVDFLMVFIASLRLFLAFSFHFLLFLNILCILLYILHSFEVLKVTYLCVFCVFLSGLVLIHFSHLFEKICAGFGHNMYRTQFWFIYLFAVILQVIIVFKIYIGCLANDVDINTIPRYSLIMTTLKKMLG